MHKMLISQSQDVPAHLARLARRQNPAHRKSCSQRSALPEALAIMHDCAPLQGLANHWLARFESGKCLQALVRELKISVMQNHIGQLS